MLSEEENEDNGKNYKFGYTTPKENPFVRESEEDLLYDYYFEKEAYNIEQMSTEKHSNEINELVNTRDTLWQIFEIVPIDLQTLGMKFDQNLLHMYKSLFSRMTKHSKVIQDNVLKGNYIESKAIFRSFLEAATIIQYFSKFPENIIEYFKAKKEQDNKILRRFSIKVMSDQLDKPYELYKKLCQSVHANIQDEDIMTINVESGVWGISRQYNHFQEDFLVEMIYGLNNILIETFEIMMNLILKEGKEFMNEDLQKIVDKTKSVKRMDVKFK
jgi:hypothetical protein